MEQQNNEPTGREHPQSRVTMLEGEIEELLACQRTMDARLFNFQSILRASRALYDCREMDDLLVLLKAIVDDRFDTDGLWFFIFDRESSSFQLRLRCDGPCRSEEQLVASRDPFSFSLGPGILWQLLRQGEPFSVVDLAGRSRFAGLFASKGLDRLASVLWLPFVMEGEPVGLLAMGPQHSGRDYDAQDLEFLRTVGEQASVAIGSVFLYDRLQHEQSKLDLTIRNLSVLYDISRAVSEIDNMKQLLLEILDKAIARVRAQKGSIMLYDSGIDQLKLQVVRGLPDKLVEDRINEGQRSCRTFRPGEGIAGKVFQTGETYISHDTQHDDNYAHSENSRVSSIICLPLLVNDKPIGVLNITNKQESHFENDDIEILSAIANQAAMTIEKADLYRLAITDELTGLYVRRFFYRRLTEELRRRQRYGLDFAVMMLDIDHFKSFNDTWGHDVGDLVLKEVAACFQRMTRTVDIVARHGGEEFTVLMPETSLEGAMRAAERLRSATEEMSVEHEDNSLKVTVSIGVASATDAIEKAEDLLHLADVALYQAKDQGRNRAIAWRQGMALPG